MTSGALLASLILALVASGCSLLPTAGPTAGQVAEQAQADGEILFDLIEVDDRVVATLAAQPQESFAARFEKHGEPPEIKIAVGDTISVTIWESAAGGLFSEAVPGRSITGSQPGIEPLLPEGGRAGSPGDQPLGVPSGPPPESTIGAEVATSSRREAVIPGQQVGVDGGISVPYAGRIPAAGRSPLEVQQTIEQRLAEKALEPQALVSVTKSSVNAVTVGGEVVAGGRVTLSTGGDRLLQVIAAAGGARAPVHDTFVGLSREGVAATIPLESLISDPVEDIYARPGDILTLVRLPQTFSVFGATGRNADIPFDAAKITLGEALAKSQGLRDDLANPKGVFLLRYEPDSLVQALDQPIATRAQGGRSPVVYRFDLGDGNSYLLARRFPIRDKDIIFVADAAAVQVDEIFRGLSYITGPILTGIVTCRSAKC